MKAEIERAEREAEEDAADAPSKQKTSEMPATLPKRKDKTKQGIDEDALPSRLNLLAAGTPGGASGNELVGTALVAA